MADDGFRVELDAETGERLREAAAAAGRSPDEYASVLIAKALGDDDWAKSKAALAHYDRTGEFVDAGVAFTELRARLIERLDRKR